MLLAGDVLHKRTRGDRRLVLRLQDAHGGGSDAAAEDEQAQDVDEETHEGERAGEDADEESCRSFAPAP